MCIICLSLAGCTAAEPDSACSYDGFLNPCIDIRLNEPFTLKNRPDRAHPDGVEDIAKYIANDITYRFILYEVHDYRCDECEAPSQDFYVKLAAIRDIIDTENETLIRDTTWVYLGIAQDAARTTPLRTRTQMQLPLGSYMIEFLSLERIPGDYRLNLSTDYKEATFALKQ